MIAGRNAARVEALAVELGLDFRVFSLDDPAAIDRALGEVAVVLHCAGPYIHTYKQVVGGCLRTGVHYLDLTGEIAVLDALAARDAEAKSRKVMLLPAVGFDGVPTDCLALHLRQRLPSATHLALAFQSWGPARLPPGTATTAIESAVPYGFKIRRNGQLEVFPRMSKIRWIDFGQGPIKASLYPWSDVFTAFYSTGIPDIEDYTAGDERLLLAALTLLRPLFRYSTVRRFFRSMLKTGSTPEERARSGTRVWGEVENDQGRKAVSRLQGPDGGVTWTSLAALAVVKRVLAGEVLPGFQTPALAYGPDLVMECEGVSRLDVT